MSAEVLPGLPASGEAPEHYHRGHPTPWTEGYVVRFQLADGSRPVGNFQAGDSYFSATDTWPEAERLIVVARGAFYLVSLVDAMSYVFGPNTATGYLLTERRDLLLVADYTDLSAYEPTGTLRWCRQLLGIDGVVPTEIDADVVLGRACSDPPDGWFHFRVRLSDGADA